MDRCLLCLLLARTLVMNTQNWRLPIVNPSCWGQFFIPTGTALLFTKIPPQVFLGRSTGWAAALTGEDSIVESSSVPPFRILSFASASSIIGSNISTAIQNNQCGFREIPHSSAKRHLPCRDGHCDLLRKHRVNYSASSTGIRTFRNNTGDIL